MRQNTGFCFNVLCNSLVMSPWQIGLAWRVGLSCVMCDDMCVSVSSTNSRRKGSCGGDGILDV